MNNYEKLASTFEVIRKYCKENNITVITATQPKRDSVPIRGLPRVENGIVIVDHISLLRP